jgi:hypothetical protein
VGWKDITRRVAERSGTALDAAYGGPVGGGAGDANVNIVRRDASGRTLPELVRAGRAEIDGLREGARGFTRASGGRVDGEPALAYDFTANGSRIRQVGTLHRGGYFVVTLTAAAPAFRRATVRLDALLRSWRWD